METSIEALQQQKQVLIQQNPALTQQLQAVIQAQTSLNPSQPFISPPSTSYTHAIASDTDMDEQQQVQLRVITPHLAKVKLTLTLPVPPTQISFIELQRFFEQHDVRSVTNIQQPVLTVTSVDKKRILDTDTVLQQYVSTYPNQPILVQLVEGIPVIAPGYVQQAWTDEYIDTQPQGHVAVMLQRCQEYHKLFIELKGSKRPYSPYIYLHQSSGMGKSRLLQQLINHACCHTNQQKAIGHNTLYKCYYFCFRHSKGDESGAWPPRSTPVVDTVTTYTTEEQWKKFFNAVRDFALKFPTALTCDSTNITWCQKFDELVSSQPAHVNNNTNQLKFIMVFDEISGLDGGINNANKSISKKSNFDTMVSVLSKFQDMFVLCADTTSKLASYSPPSDSHSSARVRQDGHKLFAPQYLMPTVNILRDKQHEAVWPACQTMRGMSQFGRPLWCGLTKRRADGEVSSTDLYNLVMSKLTAYRLITNGPETDTTVYSQLSYAAVISSMIPLLLSPGFAITNTLIASHLAVCTYVGEQRDLMLARYISEPLVSHVALSFLRSPILAELLDNLLHMLSTVQLHAGSIGEILAPLLLLIAMAQCTDQIHSPTTTPLKQSNTATSTTNQTKSKQHTKLEYMAYHIPPVISTDLDRVTDFVTVKELLFCLGGCSSVSGNLPTCLSSGIVNYNHFIAIQYQPTVSDLLSAFIRRAAYIARPNEYGTDYFIPILLYGSSHNPTKQQFQLTAHHISVMYVQTKLQVRADSTSELIEVFSKMTHTYIYGNDKPGWEDKDYIALYCNFGSTNTSDVMVNISNYDIKSRLRTPSKPSKQHCIIRLGHTDLLPKMKWSTKQKADPKTLNKICSLLDLLRDPYPDSVRMTQCQYDEAMLQSMLFPTYQSQHTV